MKRSKGMATWLIVLLATVGAVVVIGGVLVVVAVAGTRKYIANSKTAEARNSLGEIAKDVSTRYEDSAPRAICRSASKPVPLSADSVRGVKYQSTTTEWQVDRASDAGFACLRFSMDYPQYFQYVYAATPASFEAVAHGDLDGDGVLSTFKVTGSVGNDEVLQISPQIYEDAPGE